jgi:hypothetical protein
MGTQRCSVGTDRGDGSMVVIVHGETREWCSTELIPQMLASGTTFRLASSLSSACDSVGVVENFFGMAWLHAHPAQVFMRPVVVCVVVRSCSPSFVFPFVRVLWAV